jgi:hypothetical protein
MGPFSQSRNERETGTKQKTLLHAGFLKMQNNKKKSTSGKN